MVWDRESEPPVFPTRWDLLGVALGGALVWPYGRGAGFTEESVGRRPPCYLQLGQLGGNKEWMWGTIYLGITREESHIFYGLILFLQGLFYSLLTLLHRKEKILSPF